MSTSDKKVNIYLKKFLTQQQITENFLDYLQKLILESFAQVWQSNGVFDPDVSAVQILSSDTVDTFDIITPLLGTDGPLGHILNLDSSDSNNIPFENATGIDYGVGLRHQDIPNETEVNVRTGEIKYAFFKESIGELAEPDVVVDDADETLTITVDSVFEAGVSNAGRKVLVYLKNPVSQADTFEEVTVIFSGGVNKIETLTSLGQSLGSISTDPADYQVFAIGSTVRRNTDLTLDPDILFIGKMTGDNGNSPSVFDQSDVTNLSLGFAGIISLFGTEHSISDGTHTDITPETITTKQAITGLQLDTQVNASDEDTPNTPVTHTLFNSTGGSGLQDIKWGIRDSGGTLIAYIDAHGNAYFQNLAAVESIYQSNLTVVGDTIFGDDINTDTVTFNAVQQSLSDMIYIIDTNNDGSNSYKFYNHSQIVANLLMEILDTGDLEVKRDIIAGRHLKATNDALSGSGTTYSKNSDLSEISVDGSLNEVYDETLNRKILNLTANNPADKEVLIAASKIVLASGVEYKLLNGDVLSDYAGGTINFETGVVTGGGANFTPIDFTGNLGKWTKYSINLLSSDELLVIPAVGVGTTKDNAPDPTFQSGATAFAIVAIQNNGVSPTVIENVDESNFIRLPLGGGGGAAGEADIQTEFIINNNQAAPLNLTDLIYDKADYKAVEIFFDISRETDDPISLVEVGKLRLVLDTPSDLWRQPVISNSDFDDAGVVFTVDTSTGQIKYTSSNLSGGSYDGTLRIRNILKIPITSSTNKIINNNQAAPLNLTDLIYDKADYKAIKILFDISRETDDPISLVEMGELFLVLDTPSNLWRQPIISNSDFDDAGVIFSVDTSTGQLKYTSSNLSGGSYVGVLRITDIIQMNL